MGTRGLLIARYEHKLDNSDIQEIPPIGVIRCAAAKASPIENLPWVTFPPSGCLKKDNWCNVHARCYELINAGGIGGQVSQTSEQMSIALQDILKWIFKNKKKVFIHLQNMN